MRGCASRTMRPTYARYDVEEGSASGTHIADPILRGACIGTRAEPNTAGTDFLP